jgi:hypothetical protein
MSKAWVTMTIAILRAGAVKSSSVTIMTNLNLDTYRTGISSSTTKCPPYRLIGEVSAGKRREAHSPYLGDALVLDNPRFDWIDVDGSHEADDTMLGRAAYSDSDRLR